MSKNFKDFLTVILAGILTLGAISALGRTGKKEKEPEEETYQFSFAEFDDPNGGWVMKHLNEEPSYKNAVLRVYADSLENGPWLVNSSEDWFSFGFVQSDGKLVGDYTDNAATGVCEFIDENNFRYVEESGSITLMGTSIDYTSYIDVYLGESFSLKVETIDGVKVVVVNAENIFCDNVESHAVVYVKEN